MSNEDIHKAVETLIDSGDYLKDPRFTAPNFNVYDIWNTFNYMFTDKAKKAIFNLKATSTVVEYNIKLPNQFSQYQPTGLPRGTYPDRNPNSYDILDFLWKLKVINTQTKLPAYQRKLGQVRFLGSKIDTDKDIDKAVSKIAEKVNEYAEKDYIIGHLSPLSMMPMGGSDKMIIFYLVFNDEGIKFLDANKPGIEFKEGETPKELED